MSTHHIQITVASLLVVVAGVALNLWLFRIGPFWGIIGLTVTKHVAIAWVCQAVGLDRPAGSPLTPSSHSPAGPSASRTAR